MSWNAVESKLQVQKGRKSYFDDCHRWRHNWIYITN